MQPASGIRPLAQSESKARFMERLGLDERDDRHKQVYRMMKEEAAAGRHRMTSSDDSLAPHLRGDTSIQPPYSIAQISETAVHREILNIYRMARPETRQYYDLGRSTDGAAEENWVIRWLVWHVFRYRDHRNKDRRRPSQNEGDEIGSPSPSPSASGAPRPSSQMWDPVRDGWTSVK